MRLLWTVVLPAWLVLIGPLYAQAPTDEPESQRPRQAAVAPPDEAVETQPPARGQADTFNPSEKIGADSAVSFPVDI